LANLIPPGGALVRNLNSIEADFSEPVAGVDAPTCSSTDNPHQRHARSLAWQYVFEFPTAHRRRPGRLGPDSGIHDLAGTPNFSAAVPGLTVSTRTLRRRRSHLGVHGDNKRQSRRRRRQPGLDRNL